MRRSRSGSVLLMLPLLTLLGCKAGDEPPRPQPGAPLAAAIVPEANLLLEIDLQSLRLAPISAALRPLFAEVDEPEGAREGSAAAALEKRFDEAAGLRVQDFVAVLASAKLDLLDFPAHGREADATVRGGDGSEAPAALAEPLLGIKATLQESPAAVAVLLSRNLDVDQLARGARASATREDLTSFSRLEVDGVPVLRMTSLWPTTPDSWTAVVGGNTLLIAFSQQGLSSALERARSGVLATLPARVQRVRESLPEASHASLVYVAPETLREAIRERVDVAAADPAAAGLLAFVRPFRGLQSLGVGVSTGRELGAAASLHLGEEAAASQAQAIYSGILLPTLLASLARSVGQKPAEIADRIQIASEGPTLGLAYRMTAEDAAGILATRRSEAEKEAEEEGD